MTTEQRLDALEREVHRTRRVNRWLLVVFGATIVVFTGLTVTGQEKHAPTELRARALVVEDENGKTRLRLTTIKSGSSAALVLLDANGTPGMGLEMRMDGNAALLSVLDGRGSVRIGVMLDRDTTGLSLHDASGPRAVLSVDKNEAGLALHDANGTPRVSLSAARDAKMILWDASGQSVWTTPSKRTP